MADEPAGERSGLKKGSMSIEVPPNAMPNTMQSRDKYVGTPITSPAGTPAPDRRHRFWSSEMNFSNDPSRDGPMSSWSTSSDKQLGYASPGPQDRVFPIRSVVSVDPTQTPFTAPARTSSEMEGFPGMSLPGVSAMDFAGQRGRPSSRTASASEQDNAQKAARFAHANADHNPNPSAVGTGANGRMSSAEALRDRKSSTSTTHSDIYGNSSRAPVFSDSASERSVERGGDTSSVRSNATTPKLDSIGGVAATENDTATPHITARFKHIITADGHAVITGRGGETLQRCEDEPIHIPGAVQGFGLLIAVREESEGQLVVRVVSENSKRIIGYTPQELFKLNSFTDIFSEEQTDNLLDHVDFIRDEEADPASNGPEVFTISIRPPGKRAIKLWCAMHINPNAPETILCEFELDDDVKYPLSPPNEETPEPPEDTLNSNPTEAEFNESTQNASKPLRVLRSARKRKGEAAAMEVFNIMSQVQEQLASAPSLEAFLKVLVGVVKELTGFHRVMIYQFDATFNGRVVTELVDPRATKDLYKGLNFPASDIPKQARELYKINKVRLLYDRDLETARLVCRTVQDLESPLDLSFSYLRAMSPIHIKYLANMAVRSSMSISINAFGELWGLIACHGYGSKGMRVSFPIRKMCRLVGDTASRNIERLSYASRLQARKLINTVPTEANPSGYIVASSDDLLKLFDADFGLLSIRGETKILGRLEQSQEALAMLEYLRLRNITSVVTSQDLKTDFPDLRYQPGFSVIAGLLLVPLSVSGEDFIVFFRKGQVKEVKWAGNPYEKYIKEGTEGYLEPRKSFKMWTETVVGKSKEWTEEQVETGAVLCLVYGKFIEVWRQKEAALQSSQLTKLLLANSAHEVRTPLNAIINYLEIALEGALDQDTRDNLSRSHSASKSLIYVINDLLDLTKTEEGQSLITNEAFDLTATVREATDAFKGDAKRKGLEYEVTEQPGIPPLVCGDQRRVRQAVSNLVANAMQCTTSGWVKVELWVAEIETLKISVDIVVQDSGCGMSNEKLDALFRDLEQVSADNDDPFAADTSKKTIEDGKENRTLGLGLALVARIVRNMGGQLRLKSEEGKGSRFVIQLPFDLPQVGDTEPGFKAIEPSNKSTASSIPTLPPSSHGEVVLVDKATSTKNGDPVMTRKRSLEEVLSVQSFRSARSASSGGSAQSEVDRLITAIGEPINIGRSADHEEGRLARSRSKDSVSSIKSGASHSAIQASPRKPLGQKERPQAASRMKSHSLSYTPEHLRTTTEGPDGTEILPDSKTVIKAIRMPDGEPYSSPASASSKVTFDMPERALEGSKQAPAKQTADHLQVLVAEDDPVNSKIIIKRMEKLGHKVQHTVNGEECSSVYGERGAFFDVVLMDMQMPIVDGLTSTKLIRSYEKSHPEDRLSARAAANGRVPVFAVSASLVERDRQMYIDAGFDGWILKPIDFKRLNVLLEGIVDEEVRNSCLYEAGEWERGGWFAARQQDIFVASTKPSGETPVRVPPTEDADVSKTDKKTTTTTASSSSSEKDHSNSSS